MSRIFLKNLTPLIILFLIPFALYFNTLSAEFVFDDLKSIVQNENIRDISNLRGIWQSNPTRFISYLTFAANYKISQLDVTSYHIINIIIHTLAGINIFIFLKLILKTPYLLNKRAMYNKLPFLASLLFVVHPVQTQAVTYVTQRMASMDALFYILSLIFFTKMILLSANKAQTKKHMDQMTTIIFAILSLFFAALAFLTKENTFTLPLAILLIQILFFKNSPRTLLKMSYVVTPLVVAALFLSISIQNYWGRLTNLQLTQISGAIRYNDFLTFAGKFEPTYLQTQFKVIIYYIRLYIFPANQNLDYDFPLSNSFFEPVTFISFLFIITLITIGVLFRKKNPLISFGILFFFLALSIESSIIALPDVIYEHRLYLPSLGLVIVAGTIFCQVQNLITSKLKINSDKKTSYKRLSLLMLSSIIFLLSLATITRNKTWQTQISIWEDTVAKSPNKARPYNNLGIAYSNKKKYLQAAEAFEKAAIISPTYQNYRNLGLTLQGLTKYEEAVDALGKAANIEPDNYEIYSDIGYTQLSMKNYKVAKEYFEKSISLNQDNTPAYSGLTRIYAENGNPETAN